MIRPNWDSYFMTISYAVAQRGTCIRRKAGCVIVDKNNFILSTGYNGVAPGMPHCNHVSVVSEVSQGVDDMYPYHCEGSFERSGKNLSKCEAIHAEQNALLQCKDVHAIDRIYSTISPCFDQCAKLIMSTSCKTVIYDQEYPGIIRVKSMFDEKGIKLRKTSLPNHIRP